MYNFQVQENLHEATMQRSWNETSKVVVPQQKAIVKVTGRQNALTTLERGNDHDLYLTNEASAFLSTFNCVQLELETMASQKTMSSLIGGFTSQTFVWLVTLTSHIQSYSMNWSFHAVVCNHYAFCCIDELWFEKDFELVLGILRSRTERLW